MRTITLTSTRTFTHTPPPIPTPTCHPLVTAGPLTLNTCDAHCLLLFLLIPLLLLLARHQTHLLNEETVQLSDDERALRLAWASATKHTQLLGLVEQYIYGRISWGPWDAGSLRDRWPQKRYLKRLIRGGVIPLEISEGGLQTYRKKGRRRGWLDVLLPLYAQSKGRAYFVFAMPYPVAPVSGSKAAFLTRLLEQEEYAVTVSYYRRGGAYSRTRYSWKEGNDGYLEAGALSRFDLLLPFMRDRVLKDGRLRRRKRVLGSSDNETDRTVRLEDCMLENPVKAVPLLVDKPFVMVRVEALDYTPAKLDEFVYQTARVADFEDMFLEDEMSRAIGALYDVCGIALNAG